MLEQPQTHWVLFSCYFRILQVLGFFLFLKKKRRTEASEGQILQCLKNKMHTEDGKMDE